jgi:hypothetical protein
MTNKTIILEEIEALQSIFGFSNINTYELNSDGLIRLVITTSTNNNNQQRLVMDIPSTYPFESPPNIISSSSSTTLNEFIKGQTCLVSIACEILLSNENSNNEIKTVEPPPSLIVPPPTSTLLLSKWIETEPTMIQKSTFIGFAAPCNSPTEAQQLLHELLQSKKTAKATHSMWAYRIVSTTTSTTDSTSQQLLQCDNDDDGETGAGSKLAELLHLTDSKQVIVVVSRWYGGILLGSQRFKIIAMVGKSALTQLAQQ